MGHSGHHSHSHPPTAGTISPQHERAMRRVTAVSVAVASLLVLLKAGAWSATNTISLLSSLADSLFDVLASLMNFWALRYALKPADDEHRFGHNSIEDIAGLAQFAFICGSMLFIVVQSLQRLYEPAPITHLNAGLAVTAVSLLFTIGLVVYQRSVYKQTGSLIIKADSMHYVSDILMNISILASLLAMKWLSWGWIDSALAIAIAIYVIKEAWEIGERSFNNLMDREMPDTNKAEILDIIAQHPQVLGYSRLRTRSSGMRQFIEMNIDLDGTLSLEQAHAITDALEQHLMRQFPMAEVMLHQEVAAP